MLAVLKLIREKKMRKFLLINVLLPNSAGAGQKKAGNANDDNRIYPAFFCVFMDFFFG